MPITIYKGIKCQIVAMYEQILRVVNILDISCNTDTDAVFDISAVIPVLQLHVALHIIIYTVSH